MTGSVQLPLQQHLLGKCHHNLNDHVQSVQLAHVSVGFQQMLDMISQIRAEMADDAGVADAIGDALKGL